MNNLYSVYYFSKKNIKILHCYQQKKEKYFQFYPSIYFHCLDNKTYIFQLYKLSRIDILARLPVVDESGIRVLA